MEVKCSMCPSASNFKCHERAFCQTCITHHISKDLTSTHTIIEPNLKPSASSLPHSIVLCTICETTPTLQCFCSTKPINLCSLCLVTHLESSSPKSHYVQVLWKANLVDSAFPLFLDKVNRIEYGQEKLKENIKIVDEFLINLEIESSVIKNNVLTHFEGVQQEISRAEQHLRMVSKELEECKRNQEASELTFMQKYNMQMVKGKGIKLFEGVVEDEYCTSQLKKFANISVKGEVIVNDLRVYFIKPRTKELVIIDLAGQNVSKKSFSKNMSLKDSGSWCEIPNRRIFYCGGVQGNTFSNEAFIIDPSTMSIVRLPPMNQSRAVSSVLYHRGKVYIFGGYSGSNLTSCECFDLQTEKWKMISDMPIARSAFSVVEYKGFFYIAGESTFIDRYDPKTDCFMSYDGILPVISNYSTMAISDEILYIQQNNSCFEIDIEKMKLKDVHPTPQGKWWSFFPAKVCDGHIYFSRYDDSCIWVFSIKSKTMNKIKI